MDKRRRSKIPFIVMLVEMIAIAALLFYIVPYRYRLNRTVTFRESGDLVENPLMGFAPSAEDTEACEDAQLVYIGLTWAEWEPKEGVYDIAGLESKYHLEQWKSENKHAVLRFLCDVPGEEEHMDIPNWLYRQTGDGSFYDISYGRGYSPNYGNKLFREAHSRAIRALGEYCNESDFVAYVELGSLGHWGEWHTNTDEGVQALPGADICWEYVLDYSDSFYNALLLMRRNYVMVSDAGLGLYNDMVGHEEDTLEWLDWIQSGGSYETSGEALEYIPLGKFWEQAPVGGEMTSEYSMEELLGKRLQDTISLIEQSHMTFIGPRCPDGDLRDSSGAEAILKRLGYRLYISKLETRFSFGENQLNVYFTWNNTGLAPMYWDWPVTMYVFDHNDELKYWETVDLNLSELAPDKQIETTNHIPFTDMLRQGFRIGIGITDPDEEEHIKLAMDAEEIDDIQIIYTYDD